MRAFTPLEGHLGLRIRHRCHPQLDGECDRNVRFSDLPSRSHCGNHTEPQSLERRSAQPLCRFRVATAMPKVAAAAQLGAVPSRIPGQFSSWCLARFALLLDVDVDPSAHAKFLQRADLQAKRPAEHDLASSSARASGALPVFHTGQLRQAATAVRRERVPKLLTLWRRSTWIRTCSVFTVST